MTTQTVSVQVPEPIFRKLKRAADVTCRPVEEVLAATLNAALPEPSGLPPELADELASMHLFSDDALWAATEPSLSPTEQRRLGQLNRIAGQRPLTKAEEAEQEQLLAAYHRSVLRRAQALAILAQRGHPIPIETELQAAGDDSI
jgi:hypothetical protein